MAALLLIPEACVGGAPVAAATFCWNFVEFDGTTTLRRLYTKESSSVPSCCSLLLLFDLPLLLLRALLELLTLLLLLVLLLLLEGFNAVRRRWEDGTSSSFETWSFPSPFWPSLVFKLPPLLE